MRSERIESEEQLELVLSEPSEELVGLLRKIEGDIMILGIGGKIGPSLGRTAVRAVERSGRGRSVFGVSRFSDSDAKRKIQDAGIEAIECDLLDETLVGDLPKARNIIFMAGRKFGTTGNEDTTWALNVLVPAHVARAFPKSRIVVFSTGCVYPLVEPWGGGCRESDSTEPVGEYASSCLGRERVFEYYGRQNGTESAILRLNYAIDLRYGVLYDIASRVWKGERIPLSVPYVNVIWQGDVNNLALRALSVCSHPPLVLNITGPHVLSVRTVAKSFGELFGKEPLFEATGSDHSLLSDASKVAKLLPFSPVSVDQMIEWTAAWIKAGRRSLGKPTHFESSDGRF